MKKLVIIPTYNEKANIGNLLADIHKIAPDFDMLVIDDNSPDGTASVVENMAEEHRNVHLMRRQAKSGLGTAYRDGFAWALKQGYERVFTIDADYSHQPKYLRDADGLLDKYQLAVGSRYVQGGGIEGWPLGRKFLSAGGNLYARVVSGLPVRDCTGGMVGLRKELVEYLLYKQIGSEGYAFQIELKYLAWSGGYTICEFPIIFVDRKCGRSKISRRIIFEAFRLVLKLKFGKRGKSPRGNMLLKIFDRYAGVPLVWLAGLLGQKKKMTEQEIKRILVIKLSAMGDTVLLVPALRALRKKYPDARITALGTAINNDIFKACPYVDEVLTLDIKNLLLHPLRQLGPLRKGHFEVALDFDQWLRISPLLAYASGAGIRIGFKTQGQMRHFAYTELVEHKRKRHEVQCFLDILGSLGINEADESLEFWLSDDVRERSNEILEDLGISRGEEFILLHPETPTHGGQRQWPEPKYSELGRLVGRTGRKKIVIGGTMQDRAAGARITTRIGNNAVLLPPLRLMEYAGLMQKAKAIVCGNTGIMHLACALGVPVVALHGPTDPVKWGPRGNQCVALASKLECSPCLYLGYEYGCKTNRCMNMISVEEVRAALGKIVA